MSYAWPPEYDPRFRPADSEPYWNREIETMDPEERLERIILPKLQAQMAYAYARAPLYRRKWEAAGIRPEDIRSFRDYEQVPFLYKEEVRRDQAEHPPLGSYVCVDLEEIQRLHGTSGTTGRPTAFGISRGDMDRIKEAHARIMWSFGVRPRDKIFIGSFFSLYMGSWGALAGGERLGAACFPFGAGVPGQTERAIEWIKQMKPTVFYGTPSYSLYIADRARAMGLNSRKDFNFRILYFSGEPGAGIPATKKLIEETYGGLCIDSGSTAEMTPWMSNSECAARQGMHLWQDLVYTEVVDPKTGRPVPSGGQGVLVYTHLERESQPMIRFWAGDVTTWINDTCPCGRTYPRLPRGIYGRFDDMFTVRGENVYPSAIEDIIRTYPECGDEYRIIISREKSMDELVVQVEPTLSMVSQDLNGLKKKLENDFKKVLGIRAMVQITAPGILERTQFKAHRIVDRRGLYDEMVENLKCPE